MDLVASRARDIVRELDTVAEREERVGLPTKDARDDQRQRGVVAGRREWRSSTEHGWRRVGGEERVVSDGRR